MGSETLRRRLEDLLSPASRERCESVRQRLRRQLDEAPEVLVCGAGLTGRQVARALAAACKPPAAFLDDTPAKQGTRVDGVPVLAPADALARYGDAALVVVAIFRPGHSFRATRRRLEGLGFRSVVSLFGVAAAIPQDLLPFYFFDRPERLLDARDGYYRLFDGLDDSRSREELVRHLAFRLHADPDALPEPTGLDYGYLAGRLPADVCFVDGGAFDGDSVQAFLALAGGRFSRIVACEPDPQNFRKLTAYRDGLPSPVRERVDLLRGGLWSESTTLRFDATGTLGSALGNGSDEVPVVALDEYLQTPHPLFIKYDVEGAEEQALLGARRLLQRGDTALAVAAYHRPDDLWSLPALIRKINPTYRFGLRSHMDDGADLMLYAVPPSMVPAAPDCPN